MSYLKSNPVIGRLALLLALLAVVVALPALAVDKPAGGGPVAQPVPSATPTAAPTIPAVPSDPAFSRYADITALGSAWRNLDAAGMTDVGLQLAEGERILCRPHKAITADQVLGMAAKVAAEHRDTATLKRLAKAADALGKKDLAGQVAAAEKVASADPDPQADHALPVAQTSVAAFQQYKGALARVTAAKLSGDTKALDLIVQLAPQMQALPEAHRQGLAKAASTARATLPKDAKAPDRAAAALNSIAGGQLIDSIGRQGELWLYGPPRSGDYFENLGGGNWREVVAAGTIFQFREVQRTTQSITLLDGSRDIRIYLYTDTAYIQYPGIPMSFWSAGTYSP